MIQDSGNYMKNTQKIILGIIGVIIVAIIGIWGLTQKYPPIEGDVIPVIINSNTNAVIFIQTSAQLDRGDGSAVKLYTLRAEKDITALEQLQRITNVNNISLEIKTECYGSYADSLNGLNGGTDGNYWMYSVNAKTAEVGADQYKLAEGDVVEWRFTK